MKILPIVILILVFPNLLLAHPKDAPLSIQKIKEITVTKGYILSMDLWKNKNCENIWFNQIEEFKKNNPHIKDPDRLLVNQKIKVQECIENEDQTSLPFSQDKELKNPHSNWFAGVYIGESRIDETPDDSAKNGYNLGLKIGYDWDLDTSRVNVALGYLINWEQTADQNNKLGVYQIITRMLTLESSYQKMITSNWSIGPMVTAVFGDEVGMKDSRDSQKVGAYGGLETLIHFNNKYNLEINLQQRLDNLKKTHLLGNIGLRFEL